MIRKSWENKWLLTTQVEHARVSAIIAASWSFPGQKPHEEVLAAISRHDDSWKEVDENPLVNPAGAPLTFDEIEFSVGAPIWKNCAERLFDDGKYYAAKLIAGHFLHLSGSADISKMKPREVVEQGKFIGDLMALQRRCDARISAPQYIPVGDLTEEDLDLQRNSSNGSWTRAIDYDRDLRFLQVCDFLSLLLCTDFSGEMEIENVPYMAEGDKLTVTRKVATQMALTISPLPFRKNLRDHVTSVAVPRRIYGSTAELKAEIAEAKPMMQEFHFGAPVENNVRAAATNA